MISGILFQYQTEQMFYNGHVSSAEITGRTMPEDVSLSGVVENRI